MSKHHVKTHKWIRGKLQVIINEFDDLDAAVTFANNQQRNHERTNYEVETEQVVKVYDSESGELVTNIGYSQLDTYA